MSTLDRAWQEINALKGRDMPGCMYSKGVNDTVARALKIIENLGGRAIMRPLSSTIRGEK